MTDNHIDEQDILNPEDSQEADAPEVETDTSQEEDSEDKDYKALYEDSEDKRKQLFARLKREDKSKAESKVEAKATTNDQALSQKDLFALMKADVHEDDLDRVERYAKSEGKSVAEVIKDDELNAILKVRSEKRDSAKATNVKGAPRGTNKVSDDAVIANAGKGNMPDDPATLVAARRNLRVKS